MQDEVLFLDVRVLINMINPLRIERGRPTLDAVHLIALLKQKLGKIGAVLTRDASDQRFLFYIIYILGVVEYPKSMLTFRRKLIHVLT